MPSTTLTASDRVICPAEDSTTAQPHEALSRRCPGPPATTSPDPSRRSGVPQDRTSVGYQAGVYRMCTEVDPMLFDEEVDRETAV